MRSEALIERGLPANVEAEKAVLGAILLDNAAYDLAAPVLQADDFSVDAHRRIYRRMAGLLDRSRPADYTTLTEELIRGHELEAVGGVGYLSALTDGIPRAVNAEHYARIVREKAQRRRLIHTLHTHLTAAVEEDGAETAELLDRVDAALLAIARNDGRAGLESVDQVFRRIFGNADRFVESGTQHWGLLTGFRELDGLTAGLHPGELIVIGARPGMGKTALALDIARRVSRSKPVAFFTMEMKAARLLTRAVCAEQRVALHKFRRNELNDDERHRVLDALDSLAKCILFFDETAHLALGEVRSKVRRFQRERKDLGLVVIDYLQLMAPPRAENRNNEIAQLTRGLKILAMEVGCPILLLSQLSRDPDKREDARPRLAHLRDSGATEADADLVLLLYREELYLKAAGKTVTEDVRGRAELIVAKQRDGPTGTVELAFLDQYASFASITRE